MAIKKWTEHEVQVYVCKYLKSKGLKFWAVPNGFILNGDTKNIARYRNYMKEEGVTKGVFDITILLGNGKTAFLEIKTIHGKPKPEQNKWLKYFIENNYPAKICTGLGECIDFIDSLL